MLGRVFLVLILIIAAFVGIQHLIVSSSGIWANFTPLLGVLAVLFFVFNAKKILRWVGIPLIAILAFTSCDRVSSDEVGIWVQNYGKTPEDYSVVMGKAPYDNSMSTWLIKLPATQQDIDLDPRKVPCGDGVEIIADPAISFTLGRNDEDVRKYAFKFKAEGSTILGRVQSAVVKVNRDVVAEVFGRGRADSILANRNQIAQVIEDLVKKRCHEEYGVDVVTYSIFITPTPESQEAINRRLLAEQRLATEKANLEAEKLAAQVREAQGQNLTPAILEKLRLETAYNIAQFQFWSTQYMAKSPGTKWVITQGQNPNVILNEGVKE